MKVTIHTLEESREFRKIRAETMMIEMKIVLEFEMDEGSIILEITGHDVQTKYTIRGK